MSHHATVPTLTALPTKLTAGDSYTITLSLADYPASAGWTLAYTLAGEAVESFTSSASGDAHVLTLSAVATARLIEGQYQYRLRASRAGAVDTIATGPATVLPDLGTFAPGQGVSYWQTLKGHAEAALQQLMETGAPQQIMISGRMTMFRSPDDILRVIAQCENRLAAMSRGTFGTPVRFDVVGMR